MQTDMQPKSSSAPADWEIWRDKFLLRKGQGIYENHRKIVPEGSNTCHNITDCCGNIWVHQTGYLARRDGFSKVSYPVHKNLKGVYFGQFQTAEQLIKHGGLTDPVVPIESFEFTDEEDGSVHSFAWRDE